MSWFTSIFTGGIGDIIEGGVKIFDDLHLSGEEKAEAELKLKVLMQSFEEKTLSAAVEFDKQVTERHKTDMQSDSWLSKNIRPLALAVTGISIYVLAFASIFTDLTPLQAGLVETWVTALVSLFGVMVTFYFGSRGIEKVKKMATKY